MDLDCMRSESLASETTVEDEDDLDIIGYKCDLTQGNLLERYIRSVKHLARLIKRAGESGYWLEPVLIAVDMVEGVEISLPKSVGGFRVKVRVDGNCLFIMELSGGDPQDAGVCNLIGQAGSWNSDNLWSLRSDSQNTIGGGPNGRSSPDLVVAIPSKYAAAGQNLGRVVIAELEVSNRNPRQMRTDYHRYFAETTVHSVLGIKCFGNTANPAKYACAVMWSREPGEPIRVTGVWDFGFLPLRFRHRRHFETAMPDCLPAVHHHQWLLNRFFPIPVDLVTPAGKPPLSDQAYLEAALAHVQGLWPASAPRVMYTNGRPLAIFSGDMLTSYLHNLPPEAPPLENLTLDLGALFYTMVRDRRG